MMGVMLSPSMSLTLAQGFAALDAQAPPRLPSPPFFERYLLEFPWPAAVLVLALAVIVGATLSRSGKRRAGMGVIAAGVALAAGVVALAYSVETDRERVSLVTRQLITAVAEADATTVENLLTDDAVLIAPPLSADRIRKPAIVTRVGRDFVPGHVYHLREHGVTALQATMDGPTRARVQVKVRVVPEITGAPVPSWWRIDLVRAADGQWRISGIGMLSIGGFVPGGR
jgi:uncharacterized protein YjeT (DUF2065 family)